MSAMQPLDHAAVERTTPLVPFSGRSNAAMIFFAMTSSALGENAALHGQSGSNG
jgi:hypothetical protein